MLILLMQFHIKPIFVFVVVVVNLMRQVKHVIAYQVNIFCYII